MTLLSKIFSKKWALFFALLYLICIQNTRAQNLQGEKIQVAVDALTYLRFNSAISRIEFGNRDDYTAQVIGNDQLRIKTISPKPAPTNLIITEGSRTHMFVIQVLPKIDINTFKGYHDYSDLKTLKKIVKESQDNPQNVIPEPTDTKIAQNNTKGRTTKGDNPDDQKVTKNDNKKVEKPASKPSNSNKETAKNEPQAEDPQLSEKELKKAEKERKKQEEKELAARKEQEKQLAKKRAEEEAKAKKEQEELAKVKAEEQKQQQLLKEKNEALAAEKEKQRQEALALQKAKAEEQKRIAAEQKQKAKEDAIAKQKNAEMAKQAALEEAATKKRLEQEERQRIAEEKAAAAREAKRQKEIAAAKEKDRQAAIAKAEAERKAEAEKQMQLEKARKEQQAKEEALAKERQRKIDEEKRKAEAAEKEKLRQEELARKKAEAEEKARLAAEEKARQQLLALEREKARQEEQARKAAEARALAEQRAKERQEALIKNPYWKTEKHKKYPEINFAELPIGQMVTGEYFLPADTTSNGIAARAALNESPRIDKLTEEKDNVLIKLDAITFNGINSFIRITITNKRDKDFLMGKTIISWWKKSGGSYYLKPVYVTDFPIIPAGKDMSVVVACRGVNASDDDDFSISVADRLNPSLNIELPFTGIVYNKEMNRGVTRESNSRNKSEEEKSEKTHDKRKKKK